LEVSDAAYRLEAQHPNKAIGLDPGATTAITSATLDFNTGEVNNKKYDWRPLEKNLAALEQISRRLSGMIGPDRRKGQRASQRWLNLNAQRSSLHAKIRNQRQDKLHKLSRHLADHSFVAIGHWEPPRKVAGRADFKHGKTEEVLPGFKGIVKVRREGRDRSIATLRQMTAEKAERTGSTILTHAAEYNTTRQCSACKELTGPQGDRSIRHWTCSQCGVAHDRDENAALNILLLALNGVEQSKAEADSVLEKPAQGTAEELYGSPSPAEAPPEEAI